MNLAPNLGTMPAKNKRSGDERDPGVADLCRRCLESLLSLNHIKEFRRYSEALSHKLEIFNF